MTTKTKDIIGQRFGILTVISEAKKDHNWRTRLNIKCDCGTEKCIRLSILERDRPESCGCLKKRKSNKYNYLIGQKFTRLTVLGLSPRNRNERYHADTICECGNKKSIPIDCILRGNTKSCGCLGKENRANYGNRIAAIMAGRYKTMPGETGLKMIYSSYKRGAEERKHIFDISIEDFARLTQMNCHYSGHPPGNVRKNSISRGGTPESVKRGSYTYNGLDRIDNTKGYTLDNVVPCCHKCNRAKHAMSLTEWETYLDELIDFQIHKKFLKIYK